MRIIFKPKHLEIKFSFLFFLSFLDQINVFKLKRIFFTKFGEMSVIKHMSDGGFSSNTRGIFAGGYSPTLTALQNSMESVEIATLGNGVDFCDLNNTTQKLSSTSNKIRGIISGGETPSTINVIDFVMISTIGNAFDFGDLTTARRANTSFSDAHGGLQ